VSQWVGGSVIGHWSLVSGEWLVVSGEWYLVSGGGKREDGKLGICPVHEGTRGLAPLSILGQTPGFGLKLNSLTLQGVKVWLY